MDMRYFVCTLSLFLVLGNWAWGQSLKVRSAEPAKVQVPPVLSTDAPSIPLIVPAGTPLKVVLDQEVRIQKAGQPIHGKTAEPIYAFDKLLAAWPKERRLLFCDEGGDAKAMTQAARETRPDCSAASSALASSPAATSSLVLLR
jgi:hypothetical protein